MTDSGRATAAIRVARQSRRNRNTTIDRQHRALDQRVHGGFVVALGIVDRVSSILVIVTSGCVGLQLVDRLPSTRSSTSTSLAPLARKTPKETTGLAVERAKDRGSSQASVTWPRSDQPHLAAPGERDLERREICQHRRRRRACGSPARGRRNRRCRRPRSTLVARSCSVDVGRGDAERDQPVGIEHDVDLAGRRRHSGRRGRRPSAPAACAITVSSTNQESCSSVIAGADDRVGQDRLAFDIDAVDDRLVDRARQVGADARRRRP